MARRDSLEPRQRLRLEDLSKDELLRLIREQGTLFPHFIERDLLRIRWQTLEARARRLWGDWEASAEPRPKTGSYSRLLAYQQKRESLFDKALAASDRAHRFFTELYSFDEPVEPEDERLEDERKEIFHVPTL